jgi:hypothetical protein
VLARATQSRRESRTSVRALVGTHGDGVSVHHTYALQHIVPQLAGVAALALPFAERGAAPLLAALRIVSGLVVSDRRSRVGASLARGAQVSNRANYSAFVAAGGLAALHCALLRAAPALTVAHFDALMAIACERPLGDGRQLPGAPSRAGAGANGNTSSLTGAGGNASRDASTNGSGVAGASSASGGAATRAADDVWLIEHDEMVNTACVVVVEPTVLAICVDWRCRRRGDARARPAAAAHCAAPTVSAVRNAVQHRRLWRVAELRECTRVLQVLR